ncbi:MAG: VacJ family lipoprotein [Syntrophaceae bacterium]|nr:VacJ family lipoprotein [Syntrophaceae bacterium]
MKSCFLRPLLIALVILALPVLPGTYLSWNEPALATSENTSIAELKQTADQADDSVIAAKEETVVATSEKDLGDPLNSADEIIDDDFYEDEPFNNNGNGTQIADPIEPFNRAMYHFNDKLYFWVLKPVATGYNKVVPEMIRVRVKNFFTNLAFPIRFVSCILQADPSGAAQETGRFFINTIWGFAGLFDPASEPGANLAKQDADLGQSFGLWGIGQGFYIVWPVFGPSSPRDTVGMAGEFFLYPVSYLNPWYASTGVKTYEKINDTSLRLGDYEALKGAAIDPYIAIRDAYAQYRYKKIEQKRQKLWSDQTEKAEPVE